MDLNFDKTILSFFIINYEFSINNLSFTFFKNKYIHIYLI